MARTKQYWVGLDILGAAGVVNPASDYGAEYGPLSPDQLAQLDRVLTPVEYAAVSAAQGQVADTQLKVERAKGGPQSATVEVTPKGATIKSLPVIERKIVRQAGTPWWYFLIGAVGAAAIGAGLYKAVKR